MIEPVGHRIIIKPLIIERTTESGIIIQTDREARREEMAQSRGEVVAIGPDAYADQETPWCEIGDQVVFAKYAGILYRDEDDVEYRIMNDLDVVAVIK